MIFRNEALGPLFAARDKLSDMIIDLAPLNATERQQLDSLMRRHDRLIGAINQVIAATFNEAARGLGDQIVKLDEQVAALKALDNKLANLSSAITVADAIVQIAVAILGLAA